jgi:hypothetical protein
VFQDAQEVRSENSKTITSTFFPGGGDIEVIIAEWTGELAAQGFGPAPDIVHALLKGRQPIALPPTRLLRLSKDLPHDLSEQGQFLDFAGDYP